MLEIGFELMFISGSRNVKRVIAFFSIKLVVKINNENIVNFITAFFRRC